MHYKKIRKRSIGTTRVDILNNPKRVGILIQNLSANTLYVCELYKEDINAAIEVNGSNPYSDEKGASAGISLIASAASSDIRIEEIFKV